MKFKCINSKNIQRDERNNQNTDNGSKPSDNRTDFYGTGTPGRS